MSLSQISTVLGLGVVPTGIAIYDSTEAIEDDLTGGSSTLVSTDAGNPGVITGVTLSDNTGPLILTVAELNTDASVLGVIPHFEIEDTATHIEDDLALGNSSLIKGALSDISSIVVDSGPLALTVTEAESSTGITVVGDISGHSYDVTGAAVSDLAALQDLTNAPAGITLDDSASHIQTDLALGVDSHILTALSNGQLGSGAITVTGGPVTLTVSEAENTNIVGAGGSSIVGDITGHAYDVTGAVVSDLSTLQGLNYVPTGIAVADSASHIATDLGLAGSSKLLAAWNNGQFGSNSITVQSGPLTLTVGEAEYAGVAGNTGFISDMTSDVYDVTGALVADLSNLNALHYTPTGIALEDSAGNIATDLGLGVDSSNILQAGTQITSIIVDSGPLVLTVAEAETAGVADTDTGVISDISGHAYQVSDAAVADLTTLEALHYAPTGITVDDTSGDVNGALVALEALGSALLSITLSDDSPAMSMSASTLLADAGALAAITTPYALTVSSGTVTEGQAAGLSGTIKGDVVGGLAISDSATDIDDSLVALAGMGGLVASIALTGDSPVLTITSADLITYQTTLLKIGGSFGITLSDNTTADEAVDANASLVADVTAGLVIDDTAADIVGDLDGLQTLGASVASITMSDDTPATLTT